MACTTLTIASGANRSTETLFVPASHYIYFCAFHYVGNGGGDEEVRLRRASDDASWWEVGLFRAPVPSSSDWDFGTDDYVPDLDIETGHIGGGYFHISGDPNVTSNYSGWSQNVTAATGQAEVDVTVKLALSSAVSGQTLSVCVEVSPDSPAVRHLAVCGASGGGGQGVEVDVIDISSGAEVLVASFVDASWSFRVEDGGPGSGEMVVNRNDPQVSPTTIKKGNLVRITVAEIDPDPIFAFWLESGDFALLSSREEGGQELRFGGRGILTYLEHAIMWHETYLTSDYKIAGAIGSGTMARWVYTISGGDIVSRQSVTFTGDVLYDADPPAQYDWPAAGKPYGLCILQSGPYTGKGLGARYGSAPYNEFGLPWRLWMYGDAPGAILYRVVAETQAAGRPQDPLALLTIDFTASLDSDGNAWATSAATEHFTAEIGENVIELLGRLLGTGELFVYMDPDFTLHAYNTWGTDRSGGAVGPGVVRFEAGLNIASELRREIAPPGIVTHELAIGDEVTIAGVAGLKVTGDAAISGASSYVTQEIALETSSPAGTDLDAIAAADLAQRLIRHDVAEFVIANRRVAGSPGDADDGYYLPGPDGSANGDFWVGDTVTLNSGDEEPDFVERDMIVAAITIAREPNAELNVVVELGGPAGYHDRGTSDRWTALPQAGGSPFAGSIVRSPGGRPVTSSADSDVLGGTGSSTEIEFLDDLTDVEVPTPSEWDVIRWDDYQQLWVNSPLFLDDLADVSAPSPTDGYVLTWDDYLQLWIAAAVGAPTLDYGEDGDITTLDYDDVADAGSLDEIARADHRHGMPSAADGGGFRFPLDDYTLDGTHGDLFDAASLDTGLWTRRGYSSETMQISKNGEGMRLNPNGRAAGDGYLQTAPSGAFTIAAKIIHRGWTNSALSMGLVVIDSSGTGVGIVPHYGGSPTSPLLARITTYSSYQGTYVQPGSSGTNPNINYTVPLGVMAEVSYWMYIRHDSGDFYFAVSLDGEVWSAESSALTPSITIDRVGFLHDTLGTIAPTTLSRIDVLWFNRIA